MRRTSRAIAIALLAATLPLAPASAQTQSRAEITFAEEKLDILPGLQFMRSQSRRRGGALSVDAIAVDPTRHRSSARLALPANGMPHGTLRDLAAAPGTLALAGIGEAAVLWDGERLRSWPPAGPVFLHYGEGGSALRELPRVEPLLAVFEDGTSATLALGLEAPAQQARLLPGPLEQDDFAALAESAAAAFVLRTDPPRTAWASFDAARAGTIAYTATPIRPKQGDLAAEETLLLLATPSPGAATSRTVEVRWEPHPELRAASFAIGGDRWFVRNGELQSSATMPLTGIAVLARDAETGGFAIAAAAMEERGAAPFFAADAAAWIAQRGYDDAALLPMPHNGLVSDPGDFWMQRNRLIYEARGAIVFDATPRRLRFAGAGNAQPIRVATFGIDPPDIFANPKRALVDGRTAPSPRLDSHWAARVDPNDPRTANVTMFFNVRSRIAALDILHAELAGLSPETNLRAANIYLRDKATEPWRPVASFRNEVPVGRQRIALSAPVAATQARIEIVEPNFLENGDMARIAELIFWGEPTIP